MGTPFMSEIKLMSFNFPPQGWAFANGQLLPINQNQALFSLLGTTFGGNGQTNFALPNLRGRVPIHVGGGHILGEAAGSTSVTINQQQMPQHTHFLQASSAAATAAAPANDKVLAASVNYEAYRPVSNVTTLHGQTVSSVGGSQPHNNMQPYLVLNFCIALQGVFPSRN
jgi:microcystin-dependent protein